MNYLRRWICRECGERQETIDTKRNGLCQDCDPNPYFYLDAGWTRLSDIPATIARWERILEREQARRAA